MDSVTLGAGQPAGLPGDQAKPLGTAAGGPPRRSFWDRTLDHYPETAARYWYLAIVVLAAIVLYYEFYVQAAVTPSIIAHFHMSWPFFVYLVVAGNAVGAFASLLAGLSDRWGRANLVTYGLLVTGLVVLFGMPNAPNLWVYAILYALLGFVEGIILVATPALIRDFSPQMGRASAMGFWTMGPVMASLTVALVSSHTLSHLHAWQDQFIICGIVGLAVFLIAFFGLRELSPGLRGQLMVSMRDRQLVEARARGIDVDKTLAHPWRQVLHFDIIGPSLGIGVFLIVYYTLIAFLVVYMATIFGYTQQRANALGNWVWAFDAAALVLVGLASDKLRVRKPFMVAGLVGAVVTTVLFALRTDHPGTGYYTFVWILSPLAVFIGFVFAPWLAAFTETVEARNPALIATGLAIWGWVLRIVVAGSLFILPFVVTSMTPLVEHGQQVQMLAAKYAPEVATVSALDSATVARLAANSSDQVAIGKAVTEVSHKLNVPPAVALQRLVAVSKVPRSDLAYLTAHGPEVLRARAVSPGEWRRWWWVCVGAELFLLPFIFVMKGRWSPKRARQDEQTHEEIVARELKAMAA
jgi:MFS family permease